MGRIEHRRLRGRVDAWVDGELDRATAGRMARHVRFCWGCSAAAETTRLIKAALAGEVARRPRPLAATRLRTFADRLTRAT